MLNEIDTNNYKNILENIKQEILKSQYQAMQAVNKELIFMYRHIGKIILENSQWGNIVHYILNINNSNEIHIGNNLSICSSNIESFNNIEGYIKSKKRLLGKRNSDVLIEYNDISKLIIGKDFINFKHIENNDFNINIQIYNKENTIKIIITLKEKFLNLEKLRNDLYANFN